MHSSYRKLIEVKVDTLLQLCTSPDGELKCVEEELVNEEILELEEDEDIAKKIEDYDKQMKDEAKQMEEDEDDANTKFIVTDDDAMRMERYLNSRCKDQAILRLIAVLEGNCQRLRRSSLAPLVLGRPSRKANFGRFGG